MDTSNHVSIDTLDAVMAAFNSHDLDAIMEFFAEDSSFDTSAGPDQWGQRLHGKDAIRQDLAKRFASTPDAHYATERHWVNERLAVSEWLFTGTGKDGKRHEMRGCDLWEFENQKIVRKDSYRKTVTA
jgi:ketosteroid isomerase-like protein